MQCIKDKILEALASLSMTKSTLAYSVNSKMPDNMIGDENKPFSEKTAVCDGKVITSNCDWRVSLHLY